MRWQNKERNDMRRRLRKMEVDSGFKDTDEDLDLEEEDEEEEDENDNTAMVEYRGGPSASMESHMTSSVA